MKCDSATPSNRSSQPTRKTPKVLAPRKAGNKNLQFAKKLDEIKHIYALYGAIDGLSISYSSVKYWFDLLCATNKNSASDLMHGWMLTPEGIAAVAVESIVLISFSFLANVFSDKDPNKAKRFIAVVWPYLRDGLKGLKSGYKGVRGALQVAEMLTGQDIRNLILPLGLLLSGLYVCVRLWNRHVRSTRKTMMDENKQLLLAILDPQNPKYKTKLTDDDIKAILENEIKKQKDWERYVTLLAAACGGLIDGAYLYLSVVTLAALVPPVFIAMLICSVIYSITCIITRIYEEYDFQRKLDATGAKIKLAVCARQLEEIVDELRKSAEDTAAMATQISRVPTNEAEPAPPELPGLIAQRALELSRQKELLKKLQTAMGEFVTKRNELSSFLSLSALSAALAGLKNGLAAYGALASVMFGVAAVNAMFLVAFPPAFLIAGIITGMVFLIAFMTHSLIKNYVQLREQEKIGQKRHAALTEMVAFVERAIEAETLTTDDLNPMKCNDAIKTAMFAPSSEKLYYEEGFEVLRALGSGVAKGQKSVDFVLNPLLELDSAGHCHDTPLTLWVTAASATVYAGTFALRAVARGFGRPQPGSDVAPNLTVPTVPTVGSELNLMRHDNEPPNTPPASPPPPPPPSSPTLFGQNGCIDGVMIRPKQQPSGIGGEALGGGRSPAAASPQKVRFLTPTDNIPATVSSSSNSPPYSPNFFPSSTVRFVPIAPVLPVRAVSVDHLPSVVDDDKALGLV